MSGVLLETDRLRLRPWRVSDAAVQLQLWRERDPRVPPHRRISPDGHPTLEELEERIRSQPTPETIGLLGAEHAASGRVIGYCGLIPNAYGRDGEPEIAYEFLQETWGHGYATEAARAVVGWATATGYARLWATVREWNLASRRVLAKLGFVETGETEPEDGCGVSLFTMNELR